jgi:hypothetical protein
MPVKKLPVKVPEPPIDAKGAPRCQCRTGRLPCCAGDGQCIHGPDRALLVVLHGISYPWGSRLYGAFPGEGVGGVWLGVGGDLPQLPA